MRQTEPTPEQIAALEWYAQRNGRYWKCCLRADWINCRVNGPLAEVRNKLGAKWLATFQLPADPQKAK
jgi:hypothetical protein